LPVPIAGKAFAPILQANGGGALLNVLSVASWINGGELAAYSASKSAAWSLTNALRQAPAFGAVVPPAHPAGVLTWREAFMAAARS
jgi:NAD(P)-dependent dehydrogenase (short-subunit alcohol dehydrogenase family)